MALALWIRWLAAAVVVVVATQAAAQRHRPHLLQSLSLPLAIPGILVERRQSLGDCQNFCV
jgi:hypothetical protein